MAEVSLLTALRSDADLVERMRSNPHFRIGYMEGHLKHAREAIESALRLIPKRDTNAEARRVLATRVELIKRAEALAAQTDGAAL